MFSRSRLSTGWFRRTLFSGWFGQSLSSKLERGYVDAGALVCAIMHSCAKPREVVSATPGVHFAHPGPCVFFMKLEIRGGAENLSPAGDRFLGLRRSFEREQASRPPARRSTRWRRQRLMRQP